MNKADFSALPGLTLEDNEPVFNDPWQAQAFAMALSLHEKGLFTWTEWAAALSDELADDYDVENYYTHWLAALEKLVVAKGATTQNDLKTREEAWHKAAAKTPHGEPILLD